MDKKNQMSFLLAFLVTIAVIIFFLIFLYVKVLMIDKTLMGHWKVSTNDGFIVKDFSVYRQNAYLIGDYEIVYNNDIFETKNDKKAYLFNDRKERIKIPLDITLKNQGTLSLWAYAPENFTFERENDNYFLFGHVNSVGDFSTEDEFNYIQLYVNKNSSRIAVRFGNDDFNESNYFSSKQIEMNTWNHIILMWTKEGKITTFKLCHSTLEKETVKCEDFRLYSDLEDLNTFAEIGNSAEFETYDGWQGLINDVRLYNRLITNVEIAQIHLEEAGKIVPLSQKYPYIFGFFLTFVIISLFLIFFTKKDLENPQKESKKSNK